MTESFYGAIIKAPALFVLFIIERKKTVNTTKFEKGNTLVVAHRGLSGIERENTASAFVAAGNRSYYGIETDIRRTSDGHFIVSHDPDLERVAGVRLNVEESTLSEAQSVILYDKGGTKDRADLRPCTLENYIAICKKYEKHCVLELKSEFTDEETARFIEIIKSYDYLDSVTFISFIYEDLLKVRRLLPEQSAQFLFSTVTDEIVERVERDHLDVDVNYKALREENIKLFHSKGIKVNCWTVDNREAAEQLVSWGVDFITTNILE